MHPNINKYVRFVNVNIFVSNTLKTRLMINTYFCIDGEYLMEVDRVLRPGGYWILSGPPINWETHWRGWERTREDLKNEQTTIETIARSLCWKKLKQKGDIAVWKKPTNHIHCKATRRVFKFPPFCTPQNPADNAW